MLSIRNNASSALQTARTVQVQHHVADVFQVTFCIMDSALVVALQVIIIKMGNVFYVPLGVRIVHLPPTVQSVALTIR